MTNSVRNIMYVNAPDLLSFIGGPFQDTFDYAPRLLLIDLFSSANSCVDADHHLRGNGGVAGGPVAIDIAST